MNPVISLLNDHDVEIRQKTLPGSIPRSDIANLLDAIARTIEKDVDYALGIPFDSMVSSMAGKQLTANDKYFVSQVGSVPGGGCILTLKGDGVHSPDLSNFLVVSGSYSNTANVVNQLIFYFDGANYCVSVIQLPAGAVLNSTAGSSGPDTTPPAVVSIAVLNSNPSQVVITYNEALKASVVPAAGDFVITAGGSPATINSVAVSSNTVLLNLASAIIAGSSNFIQYTPGTNKIQDLAGNLAAAIPVNTLITNNVGSSATQLNAPTGLTATSISTTQINLGWTDTNTSPNESGYKIFRNTVNTFSSATQISTAAANAVSYNDAAAPAPGTLYYYWVVASGNGSTTSDSNPSTSASATTAGSAGGQLTTPTLTLTNVGSTEIDASWGAIANASSYTLQRATDAAFTQNVANVFNGNGTSYHDTGRVWGITYYYRLKAVGDGTTWTDSNWTAGQSKVLPPPFTYTGPGNPLNFDQVILMPDGVTPEISQTGGVWSTPNANGSFGNIGSNSTKLPSGTAGSVGQADDNSHIAGAIGFTKANAPTGVNSTNMVACMWITSANALKVAAATVVDGAAYTLPTGTTHIRLYTDGAGVYKAQTSTDGGSTWADFHTIIASGGYVGDLWPAADIYGGSGFEIVQPFKLGF